MPSQGSQLSFCNKCQQQTNHEVLSSHLRKYQDGQLAHPRDISENWAILQCLGCETMKVCVVDTSSDFDNPRETHYPSIQIRTVPKWASQLPNEFHILVNEVYRALNADFRCLSTMGTRAIVDTMLKDPNRENDTFQDKLNKAVNDGFLTIEQRKVIESAVEAGHAASHRGFQPSIQQLMDVLDIVEHALVDRYVIGNASLRLSASIPPRRKGGS